jgi:hypothetical protein
MAREFDGDTDYQDGDKPAASRAQALREARDEKIPVEEFFAAEPGEKPDEAPDEAEGTTPEAEPEAPPAEAEGTTPEAEREAEPEAEEAEAFLSEVDTSDWDDEERKVFAQYKGDPRELVKALSETKRHSNEQAQKLRALQERPAEEPAREEEAEAGGPPPERTAEAKPSKPTSGDEIPDTEETRALRLELNARYKANEAAKAESNRIDQEQATRAIEITKLEGKIDLLQDDLKVAELPDYERDAKQSRLEGLRRQLAELELKKTQAEVDKTKLYIHRSRLADEFDIYEQQLHGVVNRIRTEAQTRKSREAEIKSRAEQEYTLLQDALTATVTEFKIPKDREGKFRERLLRDADSHDGRIGDYKTFFRQSAREILDLGRPAGQTTKTYAETKREQARQPAPRGEKATAPVPKDEAPLTRREARKQIFADSRRIPIVPG